MVVAVAASEGASAAAELPIPPIRRHHPVDVLPVVRGWYGYLLGSPVWGVLLAGQAAGCPGLLLGLLRLPGA